MTKKRVFSCLWIAAALIVVASTDLLAQSKKPVKVLNVDVPSVSTDKSVRIDYDIVYVRSPRFGDEKRTRWAEVFSPISMDPGADLVLLHPDGSEDVLVEAGTGAVADPFVSFDGEWVYYALFHDQSNPAPWGFPRGGADIYKIHLKSRKIVRLTHQERTPNTGIIAADGLKQIPVFNLGPCPAPGGKVVFTSTRNLFEAPKMYTRGTFQLFVMDDDGANVEMIGHLNIASALHPSILRDGRVMFSSYESQGLRDLRNWGLWFIYPDGTGWGPLVSSFQQADVYHFHTQLSDGSIVFEAYYNLNNSGFGTLYKMPTKIEAGYSAFGPGFRRDPRNAEVKNPRRTRFSFTPHGLESVTRFVSSFDSPAGLSNPADPDSPRVGKFTQPSGAPDNHLLTVYSPGSVNSNGSYRKYQYPLIDSGIYLIKNGAPVDEPAQMLKIKNDPNYNEQWPRAVVPYKRTYGVAEPAYREPPANDGTASPHLPAGSPFGLVGSSSLYKRESFPGGAVAEGQVTAVAGGEHLADKLKGLRQFNSHWPFHDNWFNQGAECGLYDNSDIHAIRIIAQEPTTHGQRKFWNWGTERYRILGEIPVRKFPASDGRGISVSGGRKPADGAARSDQGANAPRSPAAQPIDPDGNPDTSFLARIPADTSFTFQMLDKHGMMLNMAQTWHQVRPGEIRHDCGGCHAHSQKPTEFKLTAAAKPDYQVLDLALQTPLLTSKEHDESGRQWDEQDESGLRFEKQGVVNVEFYRDIVPIFKRSCTACHSKNNSKPAASLALDDMDMVKGRGGGGMFREAPGGKVPATFAALAMGMVDRYGHKFVRGGWNLPQVSRYIRVYQSKRSLLAWKLLGQRTDGWSNDDFPTARVPGDPKTLQIAGKPVDPSEQRNLLIADVDYTGSVMPPPAAVKAGKVDALTEEDRRTIFRWIDLGCPIDLKNDADNPNKSGPGSGWLDDEIRPTLTIATPRIGSNEVLSTILVGMFDAFTGLQPDSFTVTTDFVVNGVEPGQNLASGFKQRSSGVWELKLAEPLTKLARGTLTVHVKDRQGNRTQLDRTFSVSKSVSKKVAAAK